MTSPTSKMSITSVATMTSTTFITSITSITSPTSKPVVSSAVLPPGVCGEASAGVHPAGGVGAGLRAAAGSGSPDHGAGPVLVSGPDLGPELQDRDQAARSRPQPGLPQDPQAPQLQGQVHGTGPLCLTVWLLSFFGLFD